MSNEPTEHLLDWLRNAHAMEQQAEHMLRAQLTRIEHYPPLKARIQQHIEETVGQRLLIEGCLKQHDASPSSTKDFFAKVMATGQAIGGMANADEVIKGAIASYAFENVEIATYTTLAAAAELAGDSVTLDACQQILPQERAMAEWLLENLPLLTEAYLLRDAAGETAKR